jgi:NADH-quinone oxidoreductase subunit N
LYAQFGTLLIPQIAQALSTFITQPGANLGLVYASLVLFIAAVGFKVGVVPFHMWVPDVYQGAPASITGWMGSAIKFAGFILATRIFWGIYAPLAIQWTAWLQVIALTTMFVGNLAALAQDNLKRLFAYSSISHAGYLLFAVSTLTPGAVDVGPIYYYLVVYGLMFLGLFGCLAFLESSSKSTEVYQLSGMGFTHPLLGVCMAVFALSAAGIPPTAGFFAKYFILLQAVKSGQTIATVIAVLSSVIGVYYYLRVLVYLYMKESKETVSLQKNKLGYLAVVFCAVCLLIAAVCPSPNVIPH